jgi:predicted RND superfamily exporter protein
MGPIVVTTVATALFFAPFAFLGNLPGHEILAPMATAVLGGLVTATVVSLFLLPALYLRFAYGKAAGEDLDLRDLWEEPPPDVDGTGNGHVDKVPSEVGAGTEILEAWPS